MFFAFQMDQFDQKNYLALQQALRRDLVNLGKDVSLAVCTTRASKFAEFQILKINYHLGLITVTPNFMVPANYLNRRVIPW